MAQLTVWGSMSGTILSRALSALCGALLSGHYVVQLLFRALLTVWDTILGSTTV